MKILAIDTATEACSVALDIGDRLLERYVELERGQAERVLPMVEEVLSEAGLALTSLDAIAFGRGPGGFTGVRLAASIAQGLAFGADLGVVPVSDLAAVAERVRQQQPGLAEVLVVNDARMREVYWATFATSPGVMTLGAELVGPATQVVLPGQGRSAEGAWAAAGRGLKVAAELAERCRTKGAIMYPDFLPRATEVLSLARPIVAAGQLLPPEQALPVYVRDQVVASMM